jgi:hypothetical protein
MFGRDPIFSIDHILDYRVREPLVYSEESDFKHRLISSLQAAWEAASEETEQQRIKMKERYDRNAKIPDIKSGDEVLLRNYIPQPNLSRKHQQNWRGVFRVIAIDGIYATIKSTKSPQSNPFKVHINQLKRYIGLEGPVSTNSELTDGDKKNLEELEAVELENQLGHTHKTTKTHNDKQTEETNETNEPKHTYNLRKNIGHAFVNTKMRARANT